MVQGALALLLRGIMSRAFVLILVFWLWPFPATDKLHGKVTVSDVDHVEIAFTIEPKLTTVRLAGAAPVAVGEFVDFVVSPGNTIKLGDQTLKITGITWVP